MSDLLRLFNGSIYQSAFEQPIPELWIQNGRVAAVESISAEAMAGATQLDLKGKTVLPAFRDGHCHPLFAAREALGLNVTNCATVSEVLAALESHLELNPEETWIDAAAYERGMLQGQEQLASRLLDEIVGDIPVVLHADDHHTLWVNTAALKAAGLGDAESVTRAQQKILHGSIDVDPTGQATGILREWEAMSLVLDVAPKLTLEQDLAALNIAQDQLLAVGVVAAVDAWIDPGMAEVYIAAAKQGSLRMRFDLAFRFAPGEWQQNLEYFASVKRQVDDLAAPQLTANTVKFFADGAFGSGTAYVSEPYLEFAAGGTHGQAVWTQEEFEAAAQAALELGLKLHIHAIGDAAVSQSLTVIEKLGAPSGSVIAHTELVAPGDFERFARLGVIANFEPYWAQQNAMLTGCHARLGTQRIDRMYAMRDALAAGAAVSFGSDWPVSSYIPLEGIQVAVTRATFEAPESRWTPEQALTASEAVHAYTEAVAGQMSDSDAGTLFAGSRADFVVLASDPLVSPMEAIAKSKVLATFVGGQNFFGSI